MTFGTLWNKVRYWLGFAQLVAPIAVEDLPDELESSKLYLIGVDPAPWSAALLCPCGCGSRIQLSLIENDEPSWQLRSNADGSITLHPSVWRIRGCRSHFFIRGNRIVWARDVTSQSASSRA